MIKNISISSNTAEVKSRIERQIEIMRQPKTALQQMTVQLFQSVMQNFREEGTDKAKWEQLSLITKFIRRHRQNAPNKKGVIKILQDKGMLRQSIYPETGEDYASVSTNLKYAKKMQFGGVSEASEVVIAPYKRKDGTKVRGFVMHLKGGHKIPARPFLTIREKNKKAIIEIARKWFFEKGKEK